MLVLGCMGGCGVGSKTAAIQAEQAAIKAGVAEYYIDTNLNKSFRYIKR